MATIIEKKRLMLLLACICVGGCGVLPSSGPYGRNIRENAFFTFEKGKAEEVRTHNYMLLEISEPLTRYFKELDEYEANTKDWPRGGKEKSVHISVNDALEVTIYESQSGGLFVPSEAGVRPGNFVTIPTQLVDRTGEINVPYVGTVSVIGRTAISVAKEIEERLGDRAIEPQVVVSIASRGGAEVSVIGEVGEAGKYTMSLNGERILGAIAKAGGPSFPGYETWVTLQRGGKEFTIPFDEIVQNPANNIPVQSEDTIYLYREPQLFQVFGASGLNKSFPFVKREMTIIEALGEAEGLRDELADPSEVYIYRTEDKLTMEDMNIQPPPVEEYKDENSVVYRLDLRAADGFFLAQNFPLKNKDVIYIGNAESTEFTKFLDVLGLTSITKISTQNAVEQ